MDFSFTEDQEALAGLARKILTDRVTHDSLTELEAGDGERFDPALWSELAAADLLGVAVPSEDGGLGGGMLEQCLVLREVGRTLAPVPVAASLVAGALPIARFGTADQRSQWVRPAVEGRKILTAALTEPHNRDSLSPATTAVRDGSGSGWRLSGVKTAVPAGTLAELILVPAMAEGRPAVFLVEPSTSGVTVEAQRTTNFDTTGLVTLDGAVVGDDAVLGRAGTDRPDVLQWLVEHATVALCAQQLGVVERAVEMIADYTTNRVQFERPIATFQAVGHRAADSYIDAEGIRLTTWQAAWALDAGEAAGLDVATAKFWAAEGGHRVAHAIVHLHGGMGVAREFPAHRYFVHAKQIEFMLGGATEQSLRIGAALARS